ncbi:MAG: spherulation-specific family 4 protein [Nitrososphaerales archaeon]
MNLLKDSSGKKSVPLAIVLLIAMSMTTAFALRASYAATSIDSGVVIPLYNYPDSTWSTIAQTAQANPNVPIIAVINPDNGPGSSQDPTYLAGVQSLQAAGVKVIGYVATGYATSSYSAVSSVESLANDYKVWYNVNGIFFDEMSNVATYESYYSTLNSYVKSDGMTYTMGNPGTSVPDGYIGILNTLVIDENQGYPSLSSITYPGYPASDFSVIAYGVSYDAAFVTSAASLVGYMYIDNLSGGNPYSTLSSLFTQTVATLAALDGSQTTSSTTSSTTVTSSSTTTTTTTSTTSSTSPITIKVKSSLAGAPLTGMYVTIQSSSGALLASGYTTFTFRGRSGTTYLVCADNYLTTIFAHWGNGLTASCQTVKSTSNLTMTAHYASG